MGNSARRAIESVIFQLSVWGVGGGLQAGADRDTAGGRGRSSPGRRRRDSQGEAGGAEGEGHRQNPGGHALGRVEFICCTSVALVYKEKTQPNKNNWNNNYNSLKTLSTAFSHFFIFYILTNFF